MSKFEDNPFGEPAVDNPFADPAVQQAGITPQSNILEDYNPFEDDNQTAVMSQNRPKTQPTQTFPSYNQNSQINSAYGSGAPQISTEELQRRQEELERKAQELERREEQLRNSGAGIRRNNWPPLPEQCCFQPCFYQDINVEIQPEFQRIVRNLYYLWGFYALIMCVNAFVALLLLLFDHGVHTFSHFVLALIYGALFTPASFMCWYRPAYKAFRSDSSFNFMVFFLIFFFQFIFLIYQSVGVPGSGYCGVITAIDQFDGTFSGIIFGLLTTVVAFSFAVCTAGSFLLLTKVHAIYRSSDKVSMDKAQAEFTNEFMRNQGVQRAASQAAQAALSSQFNNPAQNANRY